MEAKNSEKTVSFKDLINKKDVTVRGCGIYSIGVSICGELAIEVNAEDLCMQLLTLTLHENGGCTLYPTSTDLVCYINDSPDPLIGEIHLIDGTKLEVADKKLVFIDGPIPKRRRKLPPTPGTLIGERPAKPTRESSTNLNGETKLNDTPKVTRSADEPVAVDADNDHANNADDVDADNGHGNNADNDDTADINEDKNWLETSWCMLDLTDSEQSLCRNLHTPEQISILAASYFSKQLRMYTDAIITPRLLDDIFRLFMDTIDDCRDIYMDYLSDISQALTKAPIRSHTQPMHAPAVRFLSELLKQCFDPVDRVVLILDLLRTFSHFDNNLITMVHHQTTAAVLGSITAYMDVLEVQQYGIDIIAKIATHKPSLDKKAPLREVGLDMVLRSINHHQMDLPLSRSACRTLANIAATLITVLNSWLDTENAADSNVSCAIQKYENLLEYVFQEGIPVVQSIMKRFGTDLGVNTEGRKFIFYYAKLPQWQLKKSRWNKANERGQDPASKDTKQSDEEEIEHDVGDNEDGSVPTTETHLLAEEREEEPGGIMKKIGSYDNLRTSEKRLVFSDDTCGGSDSETTDSSISEEDLFEGKIAGDVAMPDDDAFSCHVVQHLVRKTIKRRSEYATECEEDISDSECEFLQSLTVKPEIFESGSPIIVDAKSIEGHKDNDAQNRNHSENVKHTHSNESGVDEASIIETYVLLDTEHDEYESDMREVITSDTAASRVCVKHNTAENVILDIRQDSGEIQQGFVASTCVDDDMRKSAIMDVAFLGKLVRTQIIVHVGSLVFQGEDSMVLMVIDKPITDLLEDTGAPLGLTEFAGNQYGASMTLMDLEPAIVISAIDAVRYRSVTKELVQSALLSLTRNITATLQTATINTTMLFFKAVFSDAHLQNILTDDEFLNEFRTCFQKATERMNMSHNVEEIRTSLASQNFVI